MLIAYNDRSSPLLITMSLWGWLPFTRSIINGIRTGMTGIATHKKGKFIIIH